MRMVMSSWRTPGISASSASICSCRGCARVISQTEMAIRCPGLTSSRSGGQSIGCADRRISVAWGSGAAGRDIGSMTVTRSSEVHLEPVSAVVQIAVSCSAYRCPNSSLAPCNLPGV